MSTLEMIDLALRTAEVVLWPLVVLVLALSFRRTILNRIEQSEEVHLGPGGVTARGRVQAAEALVKASNPTGTLDRQDAFEQVGEVIRAVDNLGRPPRILWVDDRPSNNLYEREALMKLGIVVDLSTSTEDALAKIAKPGRSYDVIISDMGRPPDTQAGYTLLDRLRRNGDDTPYVIYAGSNSPEHFDESVRRGAVGCTNRPSELIDLVRQALGVAR